MERADKRGVGLQGQCAEFLQRKQLRHPGRTALLRRIADNRYAALHHLLDFAGGQTGILCNDRLNPADAEFGRLLQDQLEPVRFADRLNERNLHRRRRNGFARGNPDDHLFFGHGINHAVGAGSLSVKQRQLLTRLDAENPCKVVRLIRSKHYALRAQRRRVREAVNPHWPFSRIRLRS